MSSPPLPESLPWWRKEIRLRACLSYSTSGSGFEGRKAESFCNNSSMVRIGRLRRSIDGPLAIGTLTAPREDVRGERHRDGDLMLLVGRCPDCGDARWTPGYRDSQLVTVNIKVTKLYKIYAGLLGTSGARSFWSPQALAFRQFAVLWG